MSIQNEIDRITNNVAEAYAAVEEKGGSVPEEANSDKLAEAIRSIESGEAAAYAVNAPIGAIILWSGQESTIPTGWHICDGTNGTEDLRGRFVLGATTEVDEEGNAAHPVGETGGEEEVTLTKSQMPEHEHQSLDKFNYIITSVASSGSQTGFAKGSGSAIGTYPKTLGSGNSKAHNNMPPYLALYYIQKISATPTDYATREDVEEMVGLPVKPITEAEYSALSDEDKNGETAWLVTDAEGSGGNGDDGSDSDGGEIYSTEEVRIGTWIDDKPLYRVVLSVITPSASTSIEYYGIPGLGNSEFVVWKIDGYVYNSDIVIQPIFAYSSADHVNVWYEKNKGIAMVASGRLISKQAVLIVEYTKTTD